LIHSYRAAGVDVAANNLIKAGMGPAVRSTYGPQVLTDAGPGGGFGGMFAFDKDAFRAPVMVASADSVGTKLKIALLLDRHDTVGIDMVNHCVDDVLTTGARPLFFLDYLAFSEVREGLLNEVVIGLAAGCRAAGCALLGGETAQLPGFYASGDYDLAGFLVGAVERDGVLGPERVRVGDVAIGLPSSGLHTNGYSLARKVLGITDDPAEARQRLEAHVPELGRTLGEELLEPHRSYLDVLAPHLGTVHALAHLTGGGLIDNPPRALPADTVLRIDGHAWRQPPIFELIQRTGNVAESEMDLTFNRGIGMIALAAPADADALLRVEGAVALGEVVPGDGQPRVEIVR
jgi:phosphoribosylformylglycinamidine cyclo-ligase